MAAENVNDLPFELKPLAPFLQRAQELKVKDPTMSYWCTYYAVQQGVHLKPREKTSRNYLMKLMLPLEAIRNDPTTKVITSNENASIYIEDFALRVFDAADNEDRRGDASRGTAKKFLAAANFLELLKVFEEASQESDPSASSAFSQHKDKIRYAKWKAGDIAKAFREGRRPTPGPAHAPEAMRRGGPSEPPYGQNGISPSAAAFQIENGSPSRFSRESSRSSSNAVSPVPGASRSHSMSPQHRHGVLPVTSADAEFNNGPRAFSPTNGIPAIRTTARPSSPLIRESTVSPTANGFGQPRPPYGYEPAARSGPPAPPRDLLTVQTPSRPTSSNPSPNDLGPNRNNLLAATPSKNGISPGGWSTMATPGGYDEKKAAEQGSPSRVPNGTKSLEGPDSAYPPKPYPPTPALALVSRKQLDDDSDDERNARPSSAARQTSFASNVTTAGALSRQTSSQTPAISEETDDLGPMQDRPPRKTVRWTPSVIGGTSTVASSSPPQSPGSPLGELPPLPESKNTSAEVRFTDHGVSPPTSNDELPVKPPKNPYAESPHPNRAQLPLPGKGSPPPNAPSPPFIPPQASSATNSAQSTPTMPTTAVAPLSQPAKRSPLPTQLARLPSDSAKNTPVPTPTSSAMNAPSAPPVSVTAFPTSGPQGLTPNGLVNGVVPRHRRASSESHNLPVLPMSALHSANIRPFVPPSSAATSMVLSTLGRPKNSLSPGGSPPNKNLTPPSSSALVSRPLPTSLDFSSMAAAKRHAKFASSALEFEDLETARRELLAALAVLNGERFT